MKSYIDDRGKQVSAFRSGNTVVELDERGRVRVYVDDKLSYSGTPRPSDLRIIQCAH